MRLLPIGVGVVTGAADGALALADAKAGRRTNLSQWSTYFEGALVIGAALAGMNRTSPDLWEPAFYGGLFGLSRRAGAWAGHQAGIGGPDYGGYIDGSGSNGGVGGRRARAAMGAPYLPAAMPPATVFGFERMQPQGLLG